VYVWTSHKYIYKISKRREAEELGSTERFQNYIEDQNKWTKILWYEKNQVAAKPGRKLFSLTSNKQ